MKSVKNLRRAAAHQAPAMLGTGPFPWTERNWLLLVNSGDCLPVPERSAATFKDSWHLATASPRRTQGVRRKKAPEAAHSTAPACFRHAPPFAGTGGYHHQFSVHVGLKLQPPWHGRAHLMTREPFPKSERAQGGTPVEAPMVYSWTRLCAEG